MEGWNNSGVSTGGEQRRRAAMYVRMSTDHQKYSTENQADAIRDYRFDDLEPFFMLAERAALPEAA